VNDVERVRETIDRLVRVAPASIVVADYNPGYVALARLETENARLRETLRVREESQIPMIPRAAHERMQRLEAESKRLREAIEVIVWIIDDPEAAGGEPLIITKGQLRILRAALAEEEAE
jgi:hypothetical protein